MKIRTGAFAVALCLANSLSFADSATDAPLVVSDPYATVQPEQSVSRTKRKNNKQKKNVCPPQPTAQSVEKSQHPQGENQETASQPNSSPSM